MCGLESADELFSQIPPQARLNRPLDLAAGISEYEIVDYFKSVAEKNAGGSSRALTDDRRIQPRYSRGSVIRPRNADAATV